MNPVPTPPTRQAQAPALAAQLAIILEGICAAVSARFIAIPALLAFTIPLWLRLDRAARRFARLANLFAAGRLPAPRPPRASHPARPGAVPPLPAPCRAPRAWLIDILREEAAGRRAQMLHLLAQPGMADFLAACPAAVHLLRPICRMLLIPRTALPAPPSRAAPAQRPPAPRVSLLDPRNWPTLDALRPASPPPDLKPA